MLSKTYCTLVFAAVAVAMSLARPAAAHGQAPPAETVVNESVLLQRLHSHNDYEQKRPLLAAVEAWLSSVEVDLWLEDGKLLVGHDRGKWRGDFETLYLQPLAQLWQQGKLPSGEEKAFLLWLDIKDEN